LASSDGKIAVALLFDKLYGKANTKQNKVRSTRGFIGSSVLCCS